ncbi:MAG TPA: DUF2085 domain-containing protein [Pyrinomonadaceae bacterium]|nr:DUF2085 domain-containing protein [Pyrinomonadaceae bacterium]
MASRISIPIADEVIGRPADQPALRAWIIWAAVAAIGIGIVGFVIAAPLAQADGYPAFAAAIYQTFSYVCHQIPERSFHLAGHKFGVCSRCTGLYSGFALAALVYPLTRSLARTDTPRIFWLILAAALLAIDFSLGYFSIWPNTHLSRFVTGALLGAVAVFYIVPGLIELTSTIKRSLKRPGRTSPPLAS